MSTLRGYTTAIDTLFQPWGLKQPTDLSNPSNIAGIIINNLIKEETVASQHSPLDSTVFAELQRAASSSHSCDSDQNLLFDILTLARFIGPHVSEYAQTTKIRLTSMSTHQGHALSRHSLPMTLFSTTKMSTSSRKLMIHHSS